MDTLQHLFAQHYRLISAILGIVNSYVIFLAGRFVFLNLVFDVLIDHENFIVMAYAIFTLMFTGLVVCGAFTGYVVQRLAGWMNKLTDRAVTTGIRYGLFFSVLLLVLVIPGISYVFLVYTNITSILAGAILGFMISNDVVNTVPK